MSASKKSPDFSFRNMYSSNPYITGANKKCLIAISRNEPCTHPATFNRAIKIEIELTLHGGFDSTQLGSRSIGIRPLVLKTPK